MTVTVLGAGSWGTALTILLARNGHDVILHGRESEHIHSIGSLRENLRYLPGFVLPDNVVIAEPDADLQPCDLWVIAVPSQGVHGVIERIAGDRPGVVMASKGIESGSCRLLLDVVKEARPDAQLSVISGPNLAVEIVRGIPTAATAAAEDTEFAERVRQAFMCRTYRVYVSSDVIGVELAGALKNVLALGAGMSDGLGYGDNTKGALLARGLNEMTQLGIAMGGRRETFMGIAGVGDLFATAASSLSRNYRVGKMMGQGLSLHEALEQVGQVAEGVSTAESALVLARRNQIQMPVFEAIEAVLRGRLKAIDGVGLLMERMPKHECI
jgi:glycerol-3-phosphate dehydrogenase (NAD(P)+)